MRIINTDEASPADLSAFDRGLVYNGLDCCITRELLDVLLPQLDNHTTGTYAFSRSLQGPCLEMRLRGVRIDKARKAEVIEDYHCTLDRLERQLYRIVADGVGMTGFNWASPKQLMELFYDRLHIPIIRRQGRPTVNRDALEKMEQYLLARPIVAHLKAMRDVGKKISVLKTEIDPDGRMRTSYNIGGTSTGRLSSSFSEFGTGTNLQNIEESLRSVFIADPGMKMAYIDAQQGESYCVGAIEWCLFGDGKYLDTCEGGDLHTSVAKLCWPRLAWVGDKKADNELAEQPYYRHYSRRFMCKKIGHGSNYGGKPQTLANQAKVDVGVVREFQQQYFTAFPAHLRWHQHVANELVAKGYLTTLTGRKRWFFGRRNDDSTLREGIAYDPQGSLADILNRGMLNVWKARDCELLMQIHDAILVQYPESEEDHILPLVMRQISCPIPLTRSRTLVIPYGAQTGWNWGKYSKSNPDGIKDYVGKDKRTRTAEVPILDRVVC
jgi:DNA polymerase-1